MINVIEPDELIAVQPEVGYKITMTGINAGGLIRRLGYYLEVGGNNITGEQSVLLDEGVAYVFNFTRDIANYLRCEKTFPDGFNTSRICFEMSVTVRLAYWEITYNPETCETTTGAVTNTPTSKVYNIGNDWDFPSLLLSSPEDIHVMNPRPNRFTSGYSKDYLYIFSEGISYKVYMDVYNLDGTVDVQYGPYFLTSLQTEVRQFGVGFANLGVKDKILKIWVEDLNKNIIYEHWNHYECYNNLVTIYAANIGGGFNSYSFEENINSVVTSSVVANRVDSTDQGEVDLVDTPSRSVSGFSSYDYFLLQREVDINDQETLRYYKQLIKSDLHMMEYAGKLFKILVTPSDWIIDKKEKTVNINLRVRMSFEQFLPNNV